jgi:hypothetical protein
MISLENTVPDARIRISRNTVLNGVLELCLPCEVGEVAFARSWRMTEGSLYTHGDPSVSSSTKPKGVLLNPPPLLHRGGNIKIEGDLCVN